MLRYTHSNNVTCRLLSLAWTSHTVNYIRLSVGMEFLLTMTWINIPCNRAIFSLNSCIVKVDWLICSTYLDCPREFILTLSIAFQYPNGGHGYRQYPGYRIGSIPFRPFSFAMSFLSCSSELLHFGLKKINLHIYKIRMCSPMDNIWCRSEKVRVRMK